VHACILLVVVFNREVQKQFESGLSKVDGWHIADLYPSRLRMTPCGAAVEAHSASLVLLCPVWELESAPAAGGVQLVWQNRSV
jgi:hypothetical protein